MVRLTLSLAMCTSISSVADNYRTFTDKEGRTVNARILKVHSETRKITLERDNKKIVIVPVSIFSKADQTYISEWSPATTSKAINSDQENANHKIRTIQLQDVAPQNDDWSCGIHNATRMLKYHDQKVTYEKLKSESNQQTITIYNSKITLGLPPEKMVTLLEKYVPSETIRYHQEDGSFDIIKECLEKGIPVITLVRRGNYPEDLSFGLRIPMLHWITVVGYDHEDNRVEFYDTGDNELHRCKVDEFKKVWDWRASDELVSGVLRGIGIKTRTLIYISEIEI